MKATHILKLLSITVLLAAGFIACKKEVEIYLPEQTDLTSKSYLRVYNSVINTSRNYVYVDKIPITGAGIVYGALFPSVSYYSAIDAGNREMLIKDTLVTSTQKPISFTSTFDAGANYTVFTYDTVNNTKYLLVKDIIEQPTDTTSRLRFANLAFSTTPVPNVDIYSLKSKANIFTNVSTAQVTGFIPFASNISDTLYVRTTGTTTNLAQLNGISPAERRSYTIVFRGRYATTTGTIARTLSSFTTY
jgi:Domain of unknown function (DUF4397)